MAYDYYDVAIKICKMLENENLSYWAAKIDNDLTTGSVSTEIFMMLRKTLSALSESNIKFSNDLSDTMQELIIELDKALN